MHSRRNAPNPLIHKLSAVAEFDGQQTALLDDLLGNVRVVPAKREIVANERWPGFDLILSGWAARSYELPDGRRQITAILMPGDFCRLRDDPGSRRYSIIALTHCQIAAVSSEQVGNAIADHPHLMQALWSASLLDEAILEEWIVNLGRREAYGRLAHLLCELHYRASSNADASDQPINFPLTQQHLADALGLTSVHVNRVLRRLRSEGVLALSGQVLRVNNRPALEKAGGFDPAYLRSRKGPFGSDA